MSHTNTHSRDGSMPFKCACGYARRMKKGRKERIKKEGRTIKKRNE